MNFAAILPEVIVCAFALATPLLAFAIPKKLLVYWALLGLVAALVAALNLLDVNVTLFSDFLIIDPFSMLFKLVFLSVAILVVIASLDFVKDEANHGEYYTLLLFATLGMMLVASSADLITLYVGIELAGISTYALAGFKKKDPQSTEAAMKYFLSGAFFSAMILFGISLVYGITGTTSIIHAPEMINIALGAGLMPVALLATLFLIAGFGFKMAAVPFQMWAPDTYEGAPTTISAFLAAGSKKMAFAAAFRVLIVAMVALRAEWGVVLGIIAVLSMTFGNVVALFQKSVKRMLAYSSIGQAGYILIGLVVASQLGYIGQLGLASSMLHIMVHAFMKGGAFIAAAAVSYVLIGDKIDDYIGLSKRAPITAFCMLIFLISLAGIVPAGGFVSKLLLLIVAVKAGGWMVFLAISLIINSVISVYYYGRLFKNMYFMPPLGGHNPGHEHAHEEVKRVKEPLAFVIPMVAAAIIVIIIGVYPMPFFDFAMKAAGALLP